MVVENGEKGATVGFGAQNKHLLLAESLEKLECSGLLDLSIELNLGLKCDFLLF